mmetsp:Transcript_15819/g.22295  ORF Transcript_15819/g.22295 Transcript_15819/m.22295 type:complete len:229 (+) Transcript_15819:2-688(+)
MINDSSNWVENGEGLLELGIDLLTVLLRNPLLFKLTTCSNSDLEQEYMECSYAYEMVEPEDENYDMIRYLCILVFDSEEPIMPVNIELYFKMIGLLTMLCEMHGDMAYNHLITDGAGVKEPNEVSIVPLLIQFLMDEVKSLDRRFNLDELDGNESNDLLERSTQLINATMNLLVDLVEHSTVPLSQKIIDCELQTKFVSFFYMLCKESNWKQLGLQEKAIYLIESFLS